MSQEFKQHLTSKWPILAHDDPTSCFPYPTKILIWFLGRFLRRRQLAKDWRLSILMLFACHAGSLWNDWVVVHLRRGKPGKDSWSDLLDAKISFPAGDFDINTDRSFEKGETRKRLTIWPPWWRSVILLTGDFDIVHWSCVEKEATRKRFLSWPHWCWHILC